MCKTNICLGCNNHTKNPKFCDNICQQKYIFKFITEPKILNGLVRERQTLKKWLIYKHGYQCFSCKLSEWMEKPIPLELDHADGNAGNNLPSNLQLLCPNCHALTPTWKNRNKGNGRAARGLKLN